MNCCGDKKVLTTAKHIAVGYSNLIRGRKYEFTDKRIETCKSCEFNYWILQALWCSVCKCFIPAKARVKDEKCPKGKWNGS
jgi:hypothetical protein